MSLLDRFRAWRERRRYEALNLNPRSAQPHEVRQNWRQRRYWREVRANMAVALVFVAAAMAGILTFDLIP